MNYRVFYCRELVRQIDDDFSFSPPRTHVYIREVKADDLGQVYRRMQGCVWSPNGEARPIIAAAGVHHTSMSIGDVAVDAAGRAWVCAERGWIKVDCNMDQSLRWNLRYSKLLHDSADKWGLDVLPGRPLIGLAPGSSSPGIVGNPYQPEPIPIVESLAWRGKPEWHRATISLFTFNGMWGYCPSVTTRDRGFDYGSFLKFCNPHPTRQAAIAAAADEISSKVQDNKLIRWARSLAEPQQLSLL